MARILPVRNSRSMDEILATEGQTINMAFFFINTSIATGAISQSVGSYTPPVNMDVYVKTVHMSANFYSRISMVMGNLLNNNGISSNTFISTTPTAQTVIPINAMYRQSESTSAGTLVFSANVNKLRNADGTDATVAMTGTADLIIHVAGQQVYDTNFDGEKVILYMGDSIFNPCTGRTHKQAGGVWDWNIRQYYAQSQSVHGIMRAISGASTTSFETYRKQGWLDFRQTDLIVYELMTNDCPTTAWYSATAEFSGNTMTVTVAPSITLEVGTVINVGTGTYITALGTGTGGTGTYTTSTSNTVASGTISVSPALSNLQKMVAWALNQYSGVKFLAVTAAPLMNSVREANAVLLRAAWVAWIAAYNNPKVKCIDLGLLNGDTTYKTTIANYDSTDRPTMSGASIAANGVVTVASTSTILAGDYIINANIAGGASYVSSVLSSTTFQLTATSGNTVASGQSITIGRGTHPTDLGGRLITNGNSGSGSSTFTGILGNLPLLFPTI